MATDADNRTIQAWPAFTLSDGTGTPQTSPIASNTTDVTLVFPIHAAQLMIKVTASDAVISSGGGTYLLPASTDFIIPGVAGDTVVIDRTTATVVYFMFANLIPKPA